MTQLPLLPVTMLVLALSAFALLTRSGPLGRVIGLVTLSVFALLPILVVPILAAGGRTMALDYALLVVGAGTLLVLAWRVIPSLAQASKDTHQEMTRMVGSSHN